jgi:hypothetical protein
MDQAPLYNAMNFSPTAADLAANPQRLFAYQALLPNGQAVSTTRLPYNRCPTDSSNRLADDPSQGSYCGSLGSQRTPSPIAACNTWLTQGVNYDNNGTVDHGNTFSASGISGMFGRIGPSIPMSRVTDGTSNVIFVGEILSDCTDHSGNVWDYNQGGNAHASTASPLNNMTTCPNSRKILNPNCTNPNNWNYSWGFRSQHVGGAQFLLVDGSVRFLSENIDYNTYQRLGGRADGNTVGDF